MNNIYFIKYNFNHSVAMVDYYDSCVIIAKSMDHVEQILNKNTDIPIGYYDDGARTITKIGTTNKEPQEVISSYNSG